MQRTRWCERIGLWIAAALAVSACGEDYWLGGRSGAADAADAEHAPASDRELDEDVVLTGDQSFELGGDGGSCRLIGNGHGIRSEDTWTGSLSIRGCTLVGLGSASSEAIAVELSGNASAVIEDTTFDASGAIHITNGDDSSTTFRNNTVLDNSVTALDPTFDASTPAFLAEGDSTAPKFFQGNRIQRSMCWFNSSNWLIGGDRDQDSNFVVGLRAGIVLAAGDLVVRGNYVHNLVYGGDESALSVVYGTGDALAEHNVLRSGTWVIRGFGGELRYNAVLDPDYDDWLNQPFEDTKVHHNLFLMCHPPEQAAPSGIIAGIHLVNDRSGGIEIYSNTLDGGGPDLRLTGPAIAIDEGCYLDSLRSNAIFNVPYERNDGGSAAIRPGTLEGVEPPPPRIAYADYNLFFNPDADQVHNYAVAVPDRAVRVDEGFGLHDARSGGPLDEQVEPGLTDPSGECFPWSDDDILAGDVTVSTMLSALREAYSPAAGSPVLAAGDPADGATNAIGAVGDGSDPADRFGLFGR